MVYGLRIFSYAFLDKSLKVNDRNLEVIILSTRIKIFVFIGPILVNCGRTGKEWGCHSREESYKFVTATNVVYLLFDCFRRPVILFFKNSNRINVKTKQSFDLTDRDLRSVHFNCRRLRRPLSPRKSTARLSRRWYVIPVSPGRILGSGQVMCRFWVVGRIAVSLFAILYWVLRHIHVALP